MNQSDHTSLKLKAIIQGIVDELMETGLSPQLLRGAISDRQETGIDGNHTPETAQGTNNPEITQQCSMLRRPKVVYELKSESGQLVSQLRVWISPSPEETKESKVVSPSVLRAAVKGISFPLGMEKIGNTDNFGYIPYFDLKFVLTLPLLAVGMSNLELSSQFRIPRYPSI